MIAIGAGVFALMFAGSSRQRAGATLAAPAGADGVTTYKAAHFSAKFPSTPVETQIPSTVGDLHIVLHIASVRSPNVEEIAEADVNPALPASEFDVNLRSSLATFAATSGMTLVSQSVTTFQGHAARQAALTTATGLRFELVAFIIRGDRQYIIGAPTGPAYDDLAASLTILP